ncbi:MAG: hypothetical protein JWM50_742 [Microbacteriaceae bacterium]|jgi:hypothetical protein|nr:hypothetical protein [Microbacteriaceae bacterium]
MSTITRGWIAFAAIGTGLIHLAMVMGSALPFGIALLAIGSAELVWGVCAMARTRLPLPRVAFAGALAPVLLWAGVLSVAVVLDAPAIAAPLPFFPLAIATMFELFVAAVLGAHLRRSVEPRPAPGAGKYLLGLLVGSITVAALTTPALAATASGAVAVPHGEHTGLLLENEHGGHR